MKNLESKEQQKLVLKLNWLYPDLIFFAIPNGGFRKKSEARRLKLEGATPGVPDLFIAQSNKNYNGLFIEMKIETGKVSKAQQEMHVRLQKKGFKVVIAYSADEAIDFIKKYLESKLEGGLNNPYGDEVNNG